MDGNRRFAKELGIDPTNGHLKGKDKLEEVTDWCLEVDVKILTVFAFSTENLKRKSEEIDWLMKLFADNFRRAGDDERAHKYGIKVRAIGQRSLLPKEVQDAIAYAEEKTKNYTNYLFNIAVAYGSREEMLRAIRNIAEDVKNGKLDSENINEELFSIYFTHIILG